MTGRLLGLLHVLESVVVDLDVQLPVSLDLVHFLYDLVDEVFVALHHDEGITEAVEGSSSVALDDPTRLLMLYLTSLTSVYLLIMSRIKGSVIESGSWPIYNLL